MPDAFSGYVTEWHGGRTRAYVYAYVESETDKTATIYVSGCAQATNISQYGVRSSCTGGGSGYGVLACPSWTADYASCSARFTVSKGSGHYETCSCTIWGDTIDGYGPISGSATATVSVWVGAKVLRPPSAPTNLTGVRNASASIDLTWTHNSTNISSTQVERAKKGESWAQIMDSSGAITSYTDSPGIGSFKYRVRCWNEDGFSGYSNETNYIATLCAPAAPTLSMPASGATIDANSKTAKLIWVHNSIDTSAQTEAQVSWSTDNKTFTTTSVTTNTHYELPITGNETVYWKVRTKGAHADYSPWSGVSLFHVRTAPVSVLQIENPIRYIPIPVSWTYDDAMGTQVSAKLQIENESGKTVFTATLGSAQSYTIPASEFTPTHGGKYTIILTVTSTTSLSYTTQAVLTVDYVPPAKPSVALATDPSTAVVIATVFEGTNEENAPPTTMLAIYRGETLLATGLHSGESIEDGLAPLDQQLVYRVVAYAESGSASEKSDSVIVHSKGFAFFNYGEDYREAAKISLNLEESDDTEGEKELYHIASSRYPKIFYGEHSTRSGTVTGDVLWNQDWFNQGERAMLSAVERLKEHNGLVYMRLPYRDSLYVNCNVSIKRSSDRYNIASVSIDWQAVSG